MDIHTHFYIHTSYFHTSGNTFIHTLIFSDFNTLQRCSAWFISCDWASMCLVCVSASTQQQGSSSSWLWGNVVTWCLTPWSAGEGGRIPPDAQSFRKSWKKKGEKKKNFHCGGVEGFLTVLFAFPRRSGWRPCWKEQPACAAAGAAVTWRMMSSGDRQLLWTFPALHDVCAILSADVWGGPCWDGGKQRTAPLSFAFSSLQSREGGEMENSLWGLQTWCLQTCS